MILQKEFFNRSSVLVAKDLLGLFLCRKFKPARLASESVAGGDVSIDKYKIIETEAYEGFDDKASHASRGKTLRNFPMFEEAGTIYIYFTYGMHWMLNIVCGPKGHPGAVLVRGVSQIEIFKRGEKKTINLSGPARLTKYLKIDKSLNNKKLGKTTGLWIESPTHILYDRNKSVYRKKFKIIRTPRIGVDYAGPIWSKKPWRFVLKEF